MEKEIKHRNFTNLLAFIALMAVAVSLIISFICNKVGAAGEIVGALNKIATVLSSIVTALCAFFYVKYKGTLWITISYIVAVVLVIVFIILV